MPNKDNINYNIKCTITIFNKQNAKLKLILNPSYSTNSDMKHSILYKMFGLLSDSIIKSLTLDPLFIYN